MRRIFVSLFLFATLSISAVWCEENVDFVREVRPILSENCSFCHGPDAATREADLRLDTADGLQAVIEKFKRDESELFLRIATDDHDSLMPPPGSNRSLTKEQIELIGRWIDQGAKWDQHWSFRPLVRPSRPAAVTGWEYPIHNAIDSFVQRELAGRKMVPSPEAPRRTLIRRLSLDLTGLPPTPQQVDQFLSDTQPGAYDRLVDRLLDSPAYGQRMAWDWLDAARYADSNGYQGDRERTMWPWRDWVVQAFNDNMPYDRFTLWQLAGDLMPGANDQQKLATGFCRNHMINGEGGRIAEENRVEYVMDMTETVGTVWLGLTLSCCRCHDHKYDPVSNKEYYQLFAFFNQTPVKGNGGDPQTAPVIETPGKDQAEKLASLDSQIATLEQKMKAAAKKLAAKQREWEAAELARRQDATQWQPLQPTKVFASGAKLRTLGDHSVLASGKNPNNDTYTVIASTALESITGIRIEALQHETMTKNGLARSDSGNFVLTGLEIEKTGPDSDQTEPIKIVAGQATFEQGGHLVTNVFDDNPKSGWAVYQGRPLDRPHTAVFRFEKPIPATGQSGFRFTLRHDSVHQKHNLGRFRLSFTSDPQPKLTDATDQFVVALQTAAKDRDPKQKALISKSHRESDTEYTDFQKKRETLTKSRDALRGSFPKVMVMADMKERRKTFVLTRGLYNKPTDVEVASRLPGFLPGRTNVQDLQGTGPADQQSANRLTLARWLVADDNPLTARVTVNRFWQQVFGIGLVKTTEDFGTQGETPVHMDLLNWLAAEFRESGWDVKHLMRLIVTSHTYRQSSKVTGQQAYEQDPENRYLSRGARYRMPSWMLRDQALAVSGLLSPTAGGPAVNTYQPEGVWEEASFGKKTYKHDSGEKLYRRSLYTFWRRIIAPTMFFDSASRQTCTVKTSRTNTPLHALQTLNNVAYVEAARALAQLALTANVDSDRERIDFIMQRALARKANDAEFDVLSGGLHRTRKQFTGAPQEAVRLISMGQSPRNESLDATEHASWTALCLAVLNFDETLTRE